MENTFVLLKPDSVQRGMVGRIISKLEGKGFKIVAGKFLLLTPELVRKLYSHHTDKPFFNRLANFMTAGPVFAFVFSGENAVKEMRRVCGATDPTEAAIGTVRGDWALSVGCNLIHCSDSAGSAQREISLFFQPDELVSYEKDLTNWLREDCWQ